VKKTCYTLLLILLSCSGLDTPVEETSIFVKDDLDSLIRLADDAIDNLNNRKEQTKQAQLKLNKRLLAISRLKDRYKDSISDLTTLKLINRDSVVYDYRIEICEIVDSVKILIPDSVCPVCTHKKEKSIFNIFKKKKNDK
jgi:rubrerythrin